MIGRVRPSSVAGTALLAVALVLVAHPRYFGTISVYPGTGWWFFPMFHAAFTALAVTCAGAGWFLLRRQSPTDRELALLAGATVVVAGAYALVLLRLTGADPGVVDGYGAKRSLVGGLVAALFLIGFALPSRRPRIVILGMGTMFVPLSLVLFDWYTGDGAVLGPVVDGFIFLTNPGILGFDHLGPSLLFATAALGFVLGVWDLRHRRSSHAPDG